MNSDEFWGVVEAARSAVTADRPFAEALTTELASRSRADILRYQERFDDVHAAVYRWDVWAAAYVIGGGCSDDSFMDFRAGLVALGRDWYEKAAACPDSLAGHPAVIDGARTWCRETVFDEDANYAAADAFERLTGDEDAFCKAWDAYATPGRGREEDDVDMGEDFDFDDLVEMRRRLPRLSALYLGAAAQD
ncbi:DUF4240 domain-containing protein [Streptomyces yangpuensis]|uniref:DUF4240 domain-containing protein n=1 Tax=Streptomyces yangpuensis TaxID=1648182 RepID=A0ABY5PZN6_9ACTN|nr:MULTISPECIES: DUF4240 domain-containing protein [Streptomyces]MBZ9597405.1 DUF4240 domain-containing protein [Streptomyces erythrochromogenes]UUY49213.1 DUF4240 domain-containing protein [Streptomyces yangpuensis]